MTWPERQRLRNWLVVGTLGAVVTIALVAYPFWLDAALGRFGTRTVALALLGLTGLVGLAWAGRRR